MKEFYLNKLNFKELLKISLDFIKKNWLYLSLGLGGYLLTALLFINQLASQIISGVAKYIANNPNFIEGFLKSNASLTGDFILFKMLQDVFVDVWLFSLITTIVVIVTCFIFSTYLFIKQDLYVKEKTVSSKDLLTFLLKRIAKAITVELALAIGLIFLLVLYLGIRLATNFIFVNATTSFINTVFILILTLIALNFSFVFQSQYKYKRNVFSSLGYSSELNREYRPLSYAFTAITTSVIILILYIIVISTFKETAISSYQTTVVLLFAVWIFLGNVLKVYKNFLFLNYDYYKREIEEPEDLYMDLIDYNLSTKYQDLKNKTEEPAKEDKLEEPIKEEKVEEIKEASKSSSKKRKKEKAQ